jgi:hypothetical protein
MPLASAVLFASSLAAPYFSALSHTRHDFPKKKSLDIKCVFSFSVPILFEMFLILRKNIRDIVINVKTSSFKVPVIFVGF